MSSATLDPAPAAPTLRAAGAGAPRFEALDSLRGVAALGVAYGHFYGPQILGGSHHFAFYLLVDLFFILSGFVLAHRYLDAWLGRRVTLATFAAHRFARLYPLHLYGLLGILAISLVRSALYAPPGLTGIAALKSGIELYPDGRAYTFVLHLLMLHNVGLTPSGLSWHGPSWSISVEFFAPLLLFWWIGLWREQRNSGWAMPVALVGAASILAIFNGAHTLDVHTANLAVWINYGILRCLGEAAIGVLTYRLYRAYGERWDVPAAVATAIEAAMVIGACALLFRRPFNSPEDVLILPIFAVLVFMLARARGALARLLLLPPLRWTGKLSYSIYINHFLVVIALSLVVFKPWWLYFGLVLALSWLTWRTIEVPAQRALNRILAPLH